MTETHPLGTVCVPRGKHKHHTAEQLDEVRQKQGSPVPGMELRIVDEDGKILPWDGKSAGEIQVRGPYIARSYFKSSDKSSWTVDGWFKTGDVATMDEDVRMVKV